MRAETFLEAMRHLPIATPLGITGGHPFVVLSPHPDDESLGVGGLIAAAASVHTRVDVVILTDGAGSHPRSIEYPRDRLVALRLAEAERALAHLGLPAARMHHFDVPDTQAPTDGADFERIVDRLAALVETSKARSLFVTWRHDPHCDHEAADAIARAVSQRITTLRLWSYPIWGWHLEPHTEIEAPLPSGFRVDITAWRAAKRAAIAAHVSQMTDLITDDPEGFRFNERTLAPFTGAFEYFLQVPL